MKPLDEVIEIFEKVVKHDYVWFDEKTALMTIETLTDTLQYLRELRDMTDIPMEYFESGGTSQNFADTSQITCPKCHSEFVILPESNEPLTWDELTQMDMQPVWYESLYWGIKVWAIVLVQKEEIYIDWYHRCQDGEIIKGNRCEIHKDQQGERWQAYRKKRG